MPADYDRLLELLEEERAFRASGRIADPWAHVVGDLVAAPAHPATVAPPRFNPRPRGKVRPGSATAAVLKYLQGRYSRQWALRQQIVVATGRSGKAVDWALIFLRSQGLLDAKPAHLNERHREYRLTALGRVHGANEHSEPGQAVAVRPAAPLGPDPPELAGGPGSNSARTGKSSGS